MKLEYIPTPSGVRYEITDSDHNTVSLAPPDAMMLLEWLAERKGQLFRETHGLDAGTGRDTGEQETL